MRLMPVLLGMYLTAMSVATAAGEPGSYRAGAREFVADMARSHGFDREGLSRLLAQASYSREVIEAMRRPWEAKPWHAYRAIFLTDARIAGGVRFWRDNARILERAQSSYGVPPEIITAIIGVETNYGGNLGKHRVIDALTTLGFSYPERADFFRKELEQFFLLTREETIDALEVTGSYAGAVGMPQFIPSSYRAYAVDFDGDGRRDLWESRADAIGSVASYFKRHGWRAGEAVAVPARVSSALPGTVPVGEKKPLKPQSRFGDLAAHGVEINDDLEPSTRVSLIRLDAPGDEYWLGLENFYVITRYNHSNLYAMAVYQLSRKIKELYEAEGAVTAAF
jgi:membrane-bound lytic murein transglycosylase B